MIPHEALESTGTLLFHAVLNDISGVLTAIHEISQYRYGDVKTFHE
jgi:hypothetical protein